jgi:hypothetical protein
MTERRVDGSHLTAAELAERIAGFPRVRLCQTVDGSSHFADWLLHERDRYLIVQALRSYKGTPDGERSDTAKEG